MHKKTTVKKVDTSPYVFQKEKIKVKLSIRELPWTEKQKAFIELAKHSDTKVILVNGPAGTSKTLLAMYVGLTLLNEHRLSDMVLIRSAVESSDSKLGYLPGDANEKMGVYATPFHDKLAELISEQNEKALTTDGRINIIPINYARGLHWAAKFVFCDESQNMSKNELKTLMTRIGEFSKVILAGDSEQSDLPKGKSGWKDVVGLFDTMEAQKQGVFCVTFDEEDILRSELCKFVVEQFHKLQ